MRSGATGTRHELTGLWTHVAVSADSLQGTCPKDVPGMTHVTGCNIARKLWNISIVSPCPLNHFQVG